MIDLAEKAPKVLRNNLETVLNITLQVYASNNTTTRNTFYCGFVDDS
jgi:hypothetical protein